MKQSQRIGSLLVGIVLAGGSAVSAAGADFALVPEMEALDGIVAQPRHAREALRNRAEGQRGLERLEAWIAAEWPRLKEVDLAGLSRFHVDQTRGFELPAQPGELTGRVIGHDEASGLWYVELRGPRLPARYDIVHRYLYVFAGYDPSTGELGQQTVTIRGWILE